MSGIRDWFGERRRATTVTVVGGAILLAAIAVFLVMQSLPSGLSTSTPQSSGSRAGEPSVVASASAAPTAVESIGPTPTATPPQIAHGQPFAATVLVNDLNVRAEPATGDATASLNAGDIVKIYEAPQSIDGIDWYSIQGGSDVYGWVSAGPLDGPYLELHNRIQANLPASVAGLVGADDAGYVAWGIRAHLAGETAEGFIAASADGATWTVGALPGAAATAATVVAGHGPAGWLLAASNDDNTSMGGLWRSDDGLTWSAVDPIWDADQLVVRQLVGFGSGYALTVRDDRSGTSIAGILTSADGVAWQNVDLAAEVNELNLIELDGGVLGWGETGEGVMVLYSPDGETWIDASQDGARAGITGRQPQIARMGDGLVAVSYELATDDPLGLWRASPSGAGFDWTRQSTAEAQLAEAFIEELVSLPDGVLAIGRNYGDGHLQLWRSADAVTWQELDAAALAAGGIDSIAATRAGLVASGSVVSPAGPNPVFLRSSDGSTWSAEAQAALGLVESSVVGDCPDVPTTMLDWLSVPGQVGAECFAGDPITFLAYSTVGGGCGGFAPGRFEPAWLASPFATFGIILEPNEAEYGGCGSAVPHPDMEDAADPHQWVQVTGHWADPAAAECRVIPLREQGIGIGLAGEERTAHECRTKFVATSVSPGPAP